VKPFAVIAIAAAALVLTTTSSTAGTARKAHQNRIGLVPHSAHASRFSPARRTAKTAGFNCVSACSAYESTINQYFTDVAAASVAGATDNVYSVATQYSGIQYSETFGGSYVDGNPFPTKGACLDGYDKYCVTNAQLQTEIGRVIAKNHWPTLSQSTLYVIFTPANTGACIYGGVADDSNPCTTNVFCAYHSVSGKGFIYAVEPDAAAVVGGGCDTGQAPVGNGADATLNTISHEQNEAITDPFGDAWYSDDAHEPENGDLCAYDFGAPLGTTLAGQYYNQVINSHDYFLQLEYSNQDGGCVPYLGGPTSPADTRNGVGPLVDHGGHGVMTTNTVYAIYWVPAAPANSKLPTISGRAKVGKKLKAGHGTWSNQPKFTYRWLRCSSAGTSCKGITKATGSSYTVVDADTGHRIEVRLTGTNMVGHASATSAPTAVVKK
jgi:hypothetical protein